MPVVIASVAVVSEGWVVLVREAEPPATGLWNLPGGSMEDGESLPAAAVREAWEETGARVRFHGVTGIYTYRVPSGRTLVNVNLRGELVGELPAGFANAEILETRWVSWVELEAGQVPLFHPEVTACILADARAGVCLPLECLHGLD